MSRCMFTLYYDEPKSIRLFRAFQRNKNVKCLDWVNIEKDVTNQVVGRVFFVEGPTILTKVVCWLSGRVISGGTCTTLVRTKNNKIILD